MQSGKPVPPSVEKKVVSRMSADQRIREKLLVAFEPVRLDVINESHLHAGHRSSPGTGESHYRVLIVAPAR